MPEEQLQTWIKSHLQALPAIPFYAKQAQQLVSEKHFDKLPLSQIIASDPGLSSQLFNLINAKRKNTKREYIESIQSALSLMGDAGIIHFVKNITTLDDIRTSFECEHDYLQLIARSQQAAKHAKAWGEKRQSQGVKEIGIATRLYDIAEFALCLFDHDNFKAFKQKNLSNNYQADQNCQSIFGFNINQLSLALCDQFHLPELVKEAHNLDDVLGIRSQGIKIASSLMHQADISWYHEQVTDYLKQAADLCQMPLEKINTLAHIISVESAHELEFEVKFHSAANLVQHKAATRPVVVKQETVLKTKVNPVKTAVPDVIKARPIATANPLLATLKSTAQDSKTSQATQLNALLNGCHQHLNMKRNALFLLNKDKSKLSTRLHSGLDHDSPLLKFTVNKAQAGLLKILLEKPQAIWINPDNVRKYEQMLPGIFKSCSLSDDFFMMSLFSGKNPVGIVFCDNYGTGKALKKPAFDLFKQAVGLTSKAMLLIGQRQKKPSPKNT